MAVGIPLKHIVESFLIEEGQDSLHKFLPYLHLASDGLRELMWDVNGSTKIEELTLNNGVATLPEDFVKEVRIAAVGWDGTLVALGRNNDIFKTTDSCGNYNTSEQPLSGGIPMSISADHFSNGQYIGRYYGVGGRRTQGEFKINTLTGEIWFTDYTNTNCTIVLEYIGYMPERVGGQFMVHPFLKEPLMNWMAYASKRRLSSTPAGLTDYLFKRYVDSKNWARQRFWNMDYDQVIEAAQRNFSQAPKY